MFTQIPNNLSSLYSELQYSYYSSSTQDMTFQIRDDETGLLLGVKKFYSTNTAQLNIAPHVRPYAMPTIDSYPMGFISTYHNGNIAVYLTMEEDDVTSPTRQFTISRSDLDLRGLLSTMPSVRTIADGDSDHLYIAAEEGYQVTVTVKKYLTPWSASYERPYAEGEFEEQLTSTSTYTATPSGENILIFNFVASAAVEEHEGYIERVEVSVEQQSVTIAQLTYQIVDSSDDALRLAWVAESGSIEHYTFPVVKSDYLGEEFARRVTLTSAFEGYATRAALAAIVRSPRVWVDDDGVYIEAKVESEAISVDANSSLGVVDVEISYVE